MKLNRTSTKLILEILRLKDELGSTACSVLMLIQALYVIRDAENPDFTNLFYTYFEKVLKIKAVDIHKVFDKIAKSHGDDESAVQEVTFEGTNADGEETHIAMMADGELVRTVESVERFMQENNRSEISCDYFTVALFESNSKTLRVVLKELAANYMDMEYFFQKDKILGYEIVPYEVSSFIRYANPVYKGKDIDIIGRDEELREVYRIMLKSSKRNVIIYGRPGVGKSAVGEKFMYEIANGKCPARFNHFMVLEMSVKDFLLSCDESHQANEKMNVLLEFLERRENDIILMIDEIQMILGKGSFFEQKKIDLSATLKPILVRGDIRIVGITTQSDYYSSFESDQTLNRRFEGVEIKEVKYKDVHKMIYPRVKAKEAEKGIRISDELIDDAIWYAACFEYHKCNPDKSIDVVDRAMANAQLDERTYVVKQDIIDVFRISYKRWAGMEEPVKKGTAYHEAGHFVASMVTKTRDMEVLAVSIYPTDDYEGVNVLEYNEEITPVMNRQYYIDSMAVHLAGRAAEEMVMKDITSGATDDLECASEMAQAMVLSFGLSEGGIAKNRVILSDGLLGLGSEETTRDAEDEVERLIVLGYKRAQELLKEYRDYLDAIAAGLLKQQILRKEELDQIWENVSKKRIAKGIPVGDFATISKKRKEAKIEKRRNVVRQIVGGARDIRHQIKKLFK